MKGKTIIQVRWALFAAALVSLQASRADIVYVNDHDGNKIETYDLATGTYLGTFASSGLSGPAAMAFDNAGNLFVSDHFGNFITKFTQAEPLPRLRQG
jgi:hypothetical protein